MKFQFFGRMPSLSAYIISDISSHDESEPYLSSSHCHQTSRDEIEEVDAITTFEWGQSIDHPSIGRAMSNVSTFCTMVQSESTGAMYDPSNKHSYPSGELDRDTTCTVDESCRSKMLEWSLKMAGFFNIERSVVSIAISYQDRFLSTTMGLSASTDRKTFRIASVTCLYIAIKLYVPHEWNVTAHAFAELCGGTISGESIVDMETQILFALGWNVHPPVPMAYLELILDLATLTVATNEEEPKQSLDASDEDSVLGDLIVPSFSNVSSDQSVNLECSVAATKENIIDVVRYQVESALHKVEFLHVRSSVIAVAALLNAIEGIYSDNDAETTGFCQHLVGVIARLISHSEVFSKRELDEVRAKLLCSATAEGESFDSSVLLQCITGIDKSFDKKHQNDNTISLSPTSTTNWNGNGQDISPKYVLSRVFAMHCNGNNTWMT